MDLRELGELLSAGVIAEFEGLPVVELLLADVRATAESPEPSVRFWGRSI